MASFYSPLSLVQKPVAAELEPEVATRSPTYASPVSLDGSSESDSEVLMCLFGPEPVDRSPTTTDLSDRGGRPFPYTRSKTRWRKRPNDELKYLRTQVVELEGLLSALNHSDSRSRLLKYGEDSGENNQVEALQRLRQESQARKMNASLMENRKLRAMVASQFQVAKALQTALDEHVRLRARKICWPSSAAASDDLVFALLDEEKELQYADTDRMLDESGVARIYFPFSSEPALQRDASGVSIHHNDVRVLPFSVELVAQALRHSLRHGSSVGPSQHCRKFEVHDGYSQAVTVDNVEVPGTLSAEIRGRHFLWSVEKGDRTIINWSSFNEYDDGNRHVRMLKRIWFALEPISNSMAQPGKTQGCVLRTVVRYTPVDPDLDPKVVEDMADIIVCGYKRDSVRVVLAVRDQLAAIAASRK
ncbi:hypothetical protein PF010_g13081 [Phytophthora fragariae]|uniref:START domain-containing protein n=1 Tax=Phytophthora fragariae TaxID=53985 RepID=A0A6G0NVK7_9STRA|nr:hypothetical protein PF010_g13081 [Phytophthora fragariae]KAE9224233.1 hypothetical protein PF004_g12288 [Phytophthora fragariae]